MVGAAGVDASGPGAAVAAEADRVAQVPGPSGRWVLVALGVVLAAMNSLFYLAVDRLPLSTVGAIEFLGTVVLAVAGARTRRNLFALVVAVGGVFALTDIRLVAEPLGFAFAFANSAGFMLYVILGHRIANTEPDGSTSGASAGPMSGIDQLGATMLIAAVAATPFGITGAATAFTHPIWLLWGVGVRGVLLGDPLRHRPVGDGPAAPSDVRVDARPAARHRHRHRPPHPAPGPHRAGPPRHRAGHRRHRLAPGSAAPRCGGRHEHSAGREPGAAGGPTMTR